MPHIEARFMFTRVDKTVPRDSTKRRLAKTKSSCRLDSSGATCFLMSVAPITKNSWSNVFNTVFHISGASCRRPRPCGLSAYVHPSSVRICHARVTAWLDWRRYWVFNAEALQQTGWASWPVVVGILLWGLRSVGPGLDAERTDTSKRVEPCTSAACMRSS